MMQFQIRPDKQPLVIARRWAGAVMRWAWAAKQVGRGSNVFGQGLK